MTEGFVPIPNAYIDRYLADLSGAELKSSSCLPAQNCGMA